MTDEPDSVDELISRYLDGEASEAEIVRVEGDPALRARAESMRAAIEAVAAPVDIPTADLDRIRSTAIAASATSEQVTDLAAAAAARSSAERRNRVLAIAAAFVFLAVGVVAIRSLPGDDDDDTAGTDTSADTSTEDATGDDSGFEADGEDDMAEESMSAMAQDEMAEEEAEDDDMAEADDMAEDDADAADTGDAPAEESAADTTEDASTGTLDRLPDELEPVADETELVDVIVAAYDTATDAENAVGRSDAELFAELCPGAALLLEEVQPAGTIGVEQAFVEVGGLPVTTVIGSGLDGSLVILTHAVDDCAVVTTQAIIDGP